MNIQEAAKILELNLVDLTEDSLQIAYRLSVKKYHPDSSNGTEKLFKDCVKARDILKNCLKKTDNFRERYTEHVHGTAGNWRAYTWGMDGAFGSVRPPNQEEISHGFYLTKMARDAGLIILVHVEVVSGMATYYIQSIEDIALDVSVVLGTKFEAVRKLQGIIRKRDEQRRIRKRDEQKHKTGTKR